MTVGVHTPTALFGWSQCDNRRRISIAEITTENTVSERDLWGSAVLAGWNPLSTTVVPSLDTWEIAISGSDQGHIAICYHPTTPPYLRT
jgi:hypothetical protein